MTAASETMSFFEVGTLLLGIGDEKEDEEDEKVGEEEGREMLWLRASLCRARIPSSIFSIKTAWSV